MAKFTTRLLPIGVQTFDYCFAEEKNIFFNLLGQKTCHGDPDVIARYEKGKHSIFFFIFLQNFKIWSLPLSRQTIWQCLTN